MTAIERAPAHATLAHEGGYNDEQLALIKRTFAAGTSDLEFALFMETAKRTGLSPLAKQIYAVKRWSKKDKREVMSIQTGIDGYRLIADRTGRWDGMEGPFWCGEDGEWREVWFDKRPPKAAKVVVYKRGATRGFPGVAHWSEYVQTDREGNPSKFWADMPATMIAKCAESLALRKAFPQELSGIYTAEEMAQADSQAGAPPVSGRVAEGEAAARPGFPPEVSPLASGAQAPQQRCRPLHSAAGPGSNGKRGPMPAALQEFAALCSGADLSGEEAVATLRALGWVIPDPWWDTVAGWDEDQVRRAERELKGTLDAEEAVEQAYQEGVAADPDPPAEETGGSEPGQGVLS